MNTTYRNDRDAALYCITTALPLKVSQHLSAIAAAPPPRRSLRQEDCPDGQLRPSGQRTDLVFKPPAGASFGLPRGLPLALPSPLPLALPLLSLILWMLDLRHIKEDTSNQNILPSKFINTCIIGVKMFLSLASLWVFTLNTHRKTY